MLLLRLLLVLLVGQNPLGLKDMPVIREILEDFVEEQILSMLETFKKENRVYIYYEKIDPQAFDNGWN